MIIKMNLNAKEESKNFSIIPKGTYWMTITKCTDRVAASGRDMVNLKCDARERGMIIGSLFHNVTFIPPGEPGHGMLVHFLHSIGMEYNGSVTLDTAELIGKTFLADVGIETWDGRERNNVVRIFSEDEIPAGNEPIKKEQKSDDEGVPF